MGTVADRDYCELGLLLDLSDGALVNLLHRGKLMGIKKCSKHGEYWRAAVRSAPAATTIRCR